MPRLAAALFFPLFLLANDNWDVAPRVVKKVDPEYTEQARRLHISGQALYRLVVDEKGRPAEIELISPLGFGLDEAGMAAIAKWTFIPGRKNGIAVPVKADIEVTFQGGDWDRKAEEKRTAWNRAVKMLLEPDRAAKALETIRNLAAQNYPAALYTTGAWKVRGEHGPAAPGEGIALIQRASDKLYPPAMFHVARMMLTPDQPAESQQAGLRLLKEASMLGSAGAQYELGTRYRAGTMVEANPERARYYLRLCAATGNAKCQEALGTMLLEAGKDPVQAVAWLQLAVSSNAPGIADRLHTASESLSPDQLARATKLSAQLVRGPR